MGMGEVRLAEARAFSAMHLLVVAACERAFALEKNRANCSGFVKEVAKTLGIELGTLGAGAANDIFLEIGRAPWIQIGTGRQAAVRAAEWARTGSLVVAALQRGRHGHVAIVTDFRDLRIRGATLDRNVAASWGVLERADLAQHGGPIRESFAIAQAENIRYACQGIKRFSLP